MATTTHHLPHPHACHLEECLGKSITALKHAAVSSDTDVPGDGGGGDDPSMKRSRAEDADLRKLFRMPDSEVRCLFSVWQIQLFS